MPALPDALPLDSWSAILLAIMAGLTALLVPFTGFMKTYFEYRIETKKAEAMKSEPAREVASAAGGALFDSMAISDLATAVKELSAAIRADTASDEAHHADRMASVIGRFTDAMDRWEEKETQNPRRGRRGHHEN